MNILDYRSLNGPLPPATAALDPGRYSVTSGAVSLMLDDVGLFFETEHPRESINGKPFRTRGQQT